MTNAKFDQYLEQLLERAKKIDGKKGAVLTAERFLLALLMEEKNAESLPVPETVKRLLTAAGIEPDTAKVVLSAYLAQDSTTSFLDDLYMKKKIAVAIAKGSEENLEWIGADLLLACILDDPSKTIAKCMAPSEPAGVEVDDFLQTLEEKVEESKDEKPMESESQPMESAIISSAKKIEDLTRRTKEIYEELSGTVYGQDNAISVFTAGYFQAELLSLTDSKRTRPRATFLFAGPPGVGKTFLAESAAKVLGLPFKRFDMSEYSDKEATIEFCGSDNVYKNSKGGNFTTFVDENPHSIVLFDEIEKAHISIIHLFLQILDAGRIRDNFSDKVIPLKDVIMIFTTNAGKQLYEDSDTGDFSGVSRKVILKALQNDINPSTGHPYFPAAICSRFASGNVVMFNHICANNLRDIAKREVLRHADNFQREIGINVELEEEVFSALLFAEGGAADARTVRSRAETFFDSELFELFRLVGAKSTGASITDIETIRIGVDLPENNPTIRSLFAPLDKPCTLVFSSEEVAELCRTKQSACEIVHCISIAQAKECLRTHEIEVILLDASFGARKGADYLNIEDMDSVARDFFHYIREMHADIPVYLIETEGHTYNSEARVSFLRQGVRGVLSVLGEAEAFEAELCSICGNLHQQHSMNTLAKSNRLVTFETAQRLTENGKVAEIRLFDFQLMMAMDAEDSKSILSNVSKPNVKFDQVIGAEEAKKELRYFVEYLKNPKKFLGTGVSAPKGILLYGPPGTGKTMLAKAMASESDVTFITADGNQFLKQYVGQGSEKVHELFRTARKYAPSIVFIDEIDAIAKERTGGEKGGAEQTLTAFLTEMDGFKNDPTKPVFVLAATNFDVEPGHDKSLDPALMRRFDRRVYIGLPNRSDRIRYMQMKIAKNAAFVISDELLSNLAIRSTGMSLAELESVMELSLRTAIREGSIKVTDAILEEAFETFNSGEKKSWDISQLERTARHEAGHAFLYWANGQTPSYVTVVARANHGGYMQHDDNEGKGVYTKEELLGRIRTALGGRAAEMVYYGPKDGLTTGASGDLESATNVARHIICSFGMDEAIGLAVIDSRSMMGDLAVQVRAEINRILEEELQNAIRLISDNRPKMDALVDALLTRNHLTGSEIKAILEG